MPQSLMNSQQKLAFSFCSKIFFSARLKAELVKLRRMYEEETEKAKQEFMYLHSSKVKPLIEANATIRQTNKQMEN